LSERKLSTTVKIKKGLSFAQSFLHLSAERTLPITNLHSLKTLESNRLEKAISPHKINEGESSTGSEILSRDLTAINDFLHFVEAEPFITPEKAENIKRVAFKKTVAA
jgi:hypothetical protein